MFVKKFSADSLDEALKTVKKELGPDAIILKTITNKGAKGLLKKKKIEITAAVTEKEYIKKAKVDTALPKELKESFYNGSASSISDSIDEYNTHSEKKNFGQSQGQGQGQGLGRQQNKSAASKFTNGGYGNLALNKMVKQNLKKSDLMKEENNSSGTQNDLDLFLNSADPNLKESFKDSFKENNKKRAPKETINTAFTTSSTETETETETENENENENRNGNSNHDDYSNLTSISIERLLKLEEKISHLSNDLAKIQNKRPDGLYNLQTNLRCLDISEKFIHTLSKRMCFELTRDELDDYDTTFDFALREISNQINCELPLFSNARLRDAPVITVLISGGYSGQTTSLLKLHQHNNNNNSLVITYKHNDLNEKHIFASKTFNLNIVHSTKMSELISECRKASAKGQSVFIDYKIKDDDSCDKENSKLFLEGLKRSFENVEVLLCLSAIHSEKYNNKIISKHRDFINGIIITYLDLCTCFGEIFNLNYNYPNIPFKFFSTGAVIPDDLEPASAERIISGLFKL
ncbi:MAG: hypothetical protein HQK49_16180 [Oligoflexia bacterium]|nr:hypothetical protein [Oligoflexia bacterium]